MLNDRDRKARKLLKGKDPELFGKTHSPNMTEAFFALLWLVVALIAAGLFWFFG